MPYQHPAYMANFIIFLSAIIRMETKMNVSEIATSISLLLSVRSNLGHPNTVQCSTYLQTMVLQRVKFIHHTIRLQTLALEKTDMISKKGQLLSIIDSSLLQYLLATKNCHRFDMHSILST